VVGIVSEGDLVGRRASEDGTASLLVARHVQEGFDAEQRATGCVTTWNTLAFAPRTLRAATLVSFDQDTPIAAVAELLQRKGINVSLRCAMAQ